MTFNKTLSRSAYINSGNNNSGKFLSNNCTRRIDIKCKNKMKRMRKGLSSSSLLRSILLLASYLHILILPCGGFVGELCVTDLECEKPGEYCEYRLCACQKCYKQIYWSCVKQQCVSDRECGEFGICQGNWNSCHCTCMVGYTREDDKCVEIENGLTKWEITGIALASLILLFCLKKAVCRTLASSSAWKRFKENRNGEKRIDENRRRYRKNSQKLFTITDESQSTSVGSTNTETVAGSSRMDENVVESDLSNVSDGPPIYRILFPHGKPLITSNSGKVTLPSYDDLNNS